MPSVSHSPRWLELGLGAADEHDHLVAALGVGRASDGDEEVVGMAAVRDGRAVLLEAGRARRRSARRRAMLRRRSPPTPTSEVADAIRRWLGDQLAQVVGERRASLGTWRTMHATWIWCIAKIIPLAAQRRESS